MQSLLSFHLQKRCFFFCSSRLFLVSLCTRTSSTLALSFLVILNSQWQQNKLPAVNYGKNSNSFPELLLHVKSKITWVPLSSPKNVMEINHGNKRTFLNGFIEGNSNRLLQKLNPKTYCNNTRKMCTACFTKLSIKNLSYYWFFKIETIKSCNWHSSSHITARHKKQGSDFFISNFGFEFVLTISWLNTPSIVISFLRQHPALLLGKQRFERADA